MMRVCAKLLGITLLLVFMTGCWSRRELNDIAITVGLGLDKKDDGYQVSAQIVNPNEVAQKKGGGGKGAPVVTYSETGGTLFEALRKMTTKTPRRLFFSHLRILVINEQLAKEGVAKTLDLLSRDHEFRTDFAIAVAKGVSAEKILKVYTVPQEIIPANKMFKSLETSSRYWASTRKTTIDELISDIVSGGKEPALTGIYLTGDSDIKDRETKANVDAIEPLSSVNFTGMAVFKKDKLIGWLTEDESKAFNYILSKAKDTAYAVPCPAGGKTTLELTRPKSDIKANTKKGKPEVNVSLQMEANIADVECDIEISKTETMDQLETAAEKQLKEQFESFIKKMQKKYNSDIFGFGEAIHRAAPREWKALKPDWDEQFAALPVNVTVDMKIRRVGTVTESFQQKGKE